MRLDAAAEAMRKTVRRSSLLFLVQGVLLALAGILLLLYIGDGRLVALADVGGWTRRRRLWKKAPVTHGPVL